MNHYMNHCKMAYNALIIPLTLMAPRSILIGAQYGRKWEVLSVLVSSIQDNIV